MTITPAGADRIDELTDFWLLLHAYQGAASVPVPGVRLREDSDTEPLVRALYLEWLSQPDSFAFFAEDDHKPVGFVIGFIEEPSAIWTPDGSDTSTASWCCRRCVGTELAVC
jgi:hypothetical protein